MDVKREDRATRVQMGVMLALGLALVAIPLYFWRRPAKTDVKPTDPTAATASLPVLLPSSSGTAPASPAVQVGEARILSCRDARKAADECDRIPAFEQALTKAVQESASCLPESAGGAAVQYVAEVNFARKKVTVSAPKDGRSIKSAKLLKPCVAQIRRSMQLVGFEGVAHAHLRYRVAVVATYGAGAGARGAAAP
jgi:hypothetical protein